MQDNIGKLISVSEAKVVEISEAYHAHLFHVLCQYTLNYEHGSIKHMYRYLAGGEDELNIYKRREKILRAAVHNDLATRKTPTQWLRDFPITFAEDE